MKKIIAMIMILVVMVSTGTAAYAADEEAPKDLIEELVEAGFIYDEYDEVWMLIEYEFYGEGEYSYIQAWYDIENNIGSVLNIEYNKFGIVTDSTVGTVKWNEDIHDFDEIACFEWYQ